MPLTAIAKTGRKAESHRPFPRTIVGANGWQLAVRCGPIRTQFI
jgi:hypothetical protein